MVGNYVTMQNEWFIVDDTNIPMIHTYNEKGFILLFRLNQTKTYHTEYVFNHYHLQEWFNITKPCKTKEIMQLVQTFAKDKIITLSKDYDLCNTVYKGNILFNINNNYPRGYFRIYNYEADRILMEYSGKEDKYKLFSLFGCLKSHYNTDSKVCYPTIERMSDETRLSQVSIIQYIDILRDLDLILYENPGTRLFQDGMQREAQNIYTMNYEGNDIALAQHIEQYKNEILEGKIKLVVNQISNEKRKLKMKLVHLDKRYKKGSIESDEYNMEKDVLEERYEKLTKQQEEQKSQK